MFQFGAVQEPILGDAETNDSRDGKKRDGRDTGAYIDINGKGLIFWCLEINLLLLNRLAIATLFQRWQPV